MAATRGHASAPRRRRKAPKTNMSGYFAVAVLILMIAGIIFVQGRDVSSRLEKYQEREHELEAGIAAETVRSDEITELEKYVNTKAYAAEQARLKLNYLGEDELLFVPEE